jgi:hypothetical protein
MDVLYTFFAFPPHEQQGIAISWETHIISISLRQAAPGPAVGRDSPTIRKGNEQFSSAAKMKMASSIRIRGHGTLNL